jgi:hypothetical protein
MKIINSFVQASIDVLKQMPILGPWLVQMSLRRKYPVEWALIRGQHHIHNQHASILHFSVNKSATQYVMGLLNRVGAENGLVPAHLHGYAFDSSLPFFDHLSAEEFQKYQYLFHPRGYVYSVFGGAIEGIPSMEEYRTVLMVRDPRDVLTSMYYSMAYSHSLPDAGGNKQRDFINKRKHTLVIGIDEFVLENAEAERRVYQRYTEQMVRKLPGLYLTRYENMSHDFNAWFTGLLDYCQLEVSEGLKKTLYKEAENIRPAKEDIHAHVRQAKPGDHQNKLMPDTIERLNAIFFQVLKDFDYA